MKSTDIEAIKRGASYEAARRDPPEGFPRLPDIPGGRYMDPAFFALEKEALWRDTWLYAIHGDEVPTPGSFVRWERAGEPLFFVRGDDGRVRCFYNTCRHRGSPVVTEEHGSDHRRFTCKYHGWTYNLRGDLVALRDKRDFVDFDLSCRSLVEVRCENLGRWHFINLNPQAGPLIESMGPIAEQLAEFEPDTLRLMDKTAFEVDCNVKVLLDAFLEVYHITSIHQHTVDRFLDHRASHITLWKGGHSRMVTPNRREAWVDPGTVGLPAIPSVDPFLGKTNLSLNMYPNLVTPVAPTGLPFLCFWPVNLTKMVIEVHWFGPSWGEGERPAVWDTQVSNFIRILDEDLQFAHSIQKSMESSGFRGMPLNYQERRIYHWHEELDRRIGPERIDPALRITPVLEPFLEDGRQEQDLPQSKVA